MEQKISNNMHTGIIWGLLGAYVFVPVWETLMYLLLFGKHDNIRN